MGGNICVKSDIYQIQNVRENCNVKSLYIVELHPDTSLLQSNQIPTQEAESPPVLRKEVKENVHSLKAGKFPGVDSIPSELFMNGGEAITTVLKQYARRPERRWYCRGSGHNRSSYPYQRLASSRNVRTIIPST